MVRVRIRLKMRTSSTLKVFLIIFFIAIFAIIAARHFIGLHFKKKEDLIEIFKSKKVSIEKEMAFTCGSGVTACILGLANSIISGNKPIIYDGSWAEYGLD